MAAQQDSIMCQYNGCLGRKYKDMYCVEHYVQFGNHKQITQEQEEKPEHIPHDAHGNGSVSNTIEKLAISVTPPGGQQQKQQTPAKFMRFGGGGVPCTVCSKTAYPAETVQFENKMFHADCFRCVKCNKRVEQPTASLYEGQVYCRPCFNKEGLVRKQAQVSWQKSASFSAGTSKFGGGGNPCHKCSKTVYAGEASSYDGRVYHQQCLDCFDCHKGLPIPEIAGSFEDHIFCRPCWNKGGYARRQLDAGSNSRRNSVPGTGKYDSRFATLGGGGNPCFKCQKTVYSAEAVLFEGRQYHVKCVNCNVCGKNCPIQALGGSFEGQLYCVPCWDHGKFAQKQLDIKPSLSYKPGTSGGYSTRFATLGGGGQKCFACGKTAYPAESLNFNGHIYHATCFKCIHCQKDIQTLSSAEAKGDRVYCNHCFNELGLWRPDA